MSDIFISYVSEDLHRVLPLIRALEVRGWSVWWDRSIPPGRVFDEIIEEALNASKCVIVVWSVHSISSRWVRDEAEEARNRQILIPVLFDDVRIPLAFRLFQAANLISWEGNPDDPRLVSLFASIEAIILPHGEDSAAPVAPVPVLDTSTGN